MKRTINQLDVDNNDLLDITPMTGIQGKLTAMHSNFIRVGMCALGLLLTNCAVDGTEVDSTETDLGSAESALTISTSQQGTDGNWYSFWKDGGNVTMDLNGGGNFAVHWASGTYNFTGGKGWGTGSSTRKVGYNAGIWSTGSGNAILSLYGWTKNSLIEYYVVETWGNQRPTPPSGVSVAGQVTSDGGTYDIWRAQRVNAPSISGTQTFYQYWSVRTTKKPQGSNNQITFANHVNAWAAKGWHLGSTHNYQIISTEVYNPTSSGEDNVTVWENF